MSFDFATVNWLDGELKAPGVQSSFKTLGQLQDVFRDQKAFASMDVATIVYRVWWWEPVPAGTEGGLFWGTTEIMPGKVGCEYFMTRGHQHAIRDRAEFYGTVSGEGVLVLRDEDGKNRFEPMQPGTLHYIPGRVAHRTVNTGRMPLRFVACWPSDAGHDYASEGIGARVVEQEGKPVFIQDGDKP
jgi:glucose-6-phosphate isomerase, archaeal